MILRRIFGLSMATLLVQLTFASSDLACAKHSGHSAEPVRHAAPDRQAMGDMADHDHEPASDEEPCEIPAQSDCCQALVSCSMTLGLGSASASATSHDAHFSVVAFAAEAPAYLIRAPEPPPPKP